MNLVYVYIKLKRTRFICIGDFETDNIIEILTSKTTNNIINNFMGNYIILLSSKTTNNIIEIFLKYMINFFLMIK